MRINLPAEPIALAQQIAARKHDPTDLLSEALATLRLERGKFSSML